MTYLDDDRDRIPYGQPADDDVHASSYRPGDPGTVAASPSVRAAVQRALELIAEEGSLRERARLAELGIGNQQEAAELFRQAGVRRRERLALLERCGLTR